MCAAAAMDPIKKEQSAFLFRQTGGNTRHGICDLKSSLAQNGDVVPARKEID
jgi:hypothetical protein